MLIALNQILSSGGTQRVLVNAQAITNIRLVDNENGYGSIVCTYIGMIRVTETPQQILEIVSSATHKTKAI